jgi:hypothetical protein
MEANKCQLTPPEDWEPDIHPEQLRLLGDEELGIVVGESEIDCDE